MNVPLPEGTCRAWAGPTTLYVYKDGVRTTYYYSDAEFRQGASTTYNAIPSGTNCTTENPAYKPELEIYNLHLILAALLAIGMIISKVIRGRREEI